jgi:Holliday junction resolvase RusA-like endonuclease
MTPDEREPAEGSLAIGVGLVLLLSALPPSVNNLYPQGRDGRRHLSREGRAWHDLVAAECLAARLRPFADRRTRLDMAVWFRGLGYTRDLDGTLKALVDALAAALNFDDRYVESINAKRVPLERCVPRVRETRVVLRWQQEVSGP